MVSACEKQIIYAIDTIQLEQVGSDKTTRKNGLEFISIAYADLFGTAISQSKLNNLSVAYRSVGDKTLVEEMLIKNFLNDPGAQLPSQTEMNADVDGFLSEACERIFNRDISNYELWFLKDLITNNQDISPEFIYFGMMTSEEYRYY